MKNNNIFFWQPQVDLLKIMTGSEWSRKLLVFLNYFIWVFFFGVSFFIIRTDINYFWRILFATVTSELVERIIKAKVFWRRPMFVRHDKTPEGLVDSWYKTGSFPSGHTIKATYFFLFALASNSFSPELFLLVTLPLLVFRVAIGFHYPIDMIGGIIIGVIIWFINNWYYFPENLNHFIQIIFNFIFNLN